MNLLCRECNEYLIGSYQILCLLGHTKTGLVRPEESQIRQLVCQRHDIQFDLEQSRPKEADLDTLIFAVVPGISFAGGNFNGAYSMDQDEALKKSGNFDQAVYLTNEGIRITFPISLESLLVEFQSWPDEVAAKTAIKQYYLTRNIRHKGVLEGALAHIIYGRK